MQCPKCGGEAYLVDEELVQVLENVDPPKIIAKAIYQCRSCGDRFTRLVSETLDAKKKVPDQPAGQAQQGHSSGSSDDNLANVSPETRERIDQLKFF
jgi:phage terminase large subunit GpA-like protein